MALFVGILCLSGLCFVMHYLVSFSSLQRKKKKRAGCLVLIVFLMSYDCYFSVALPQGVVCWSADV